MKDKNLIECLGYFLAVIVGFVVLMYNLPNAPLWRSVLGAYLMISGPIGIAFCVARSLNDEETNEKGSD